MKFDILHPKKTPSRRWPIPVVRMEGVIGRESRGRSITAAAMDPALRAAFNLQGAPAVVLVINSPGGSPVQSSLIVKRVRQLSEKSKRPVLAVVEDVAASGGYMLACAGDEIIADPSSIVGSIGVVSGGFGFVDLMQKLGVERRLRTSGAHKARSDAFAPRDPDDEHRLKSIMDQLHREFIDLVKQRRVGKLKDHPHLFEGEVFTAREGMDLGLIDGFGTLHGEIARRFGAGSALKTLGPVRPPLLQRFFSGIGRSAIDGALEALEERALLSRYGL